MAAPTNRYATSDPHVRSSYTHTDCILLKWRIEPLGEGYSIRSISSGKYVTFEERIGDGALAIANGFPVSWDVSSVWNSSDV